jgi:rRNA endonuclease
MKFGNGLCDRVPTHTKNGNGKDDNYLLEFPVFPDGHAYNFNKKPKDDPGAARVIYTYPQKVFCGVVSHTNGNQGDLRLCRRV